MAVRYSATRALIAATALAGLTGCAHGAQQALAQQKQQSEALQARLDESERVNGRLTVRIEELEDAVFLLQDRVDANRIALQRRGIMGPQATANTYAQRAPQGTHYGTAPPVYPQPRQVAPEQTVTRIPLGGGEQPYVDQVPTSNVPVATTTTTTATGGEDSDVVVIGEDEFRQFERRHGGTTSGVQAKSPSGSSSGKRAQPPVTSERLATTEELDPGPSKPADSKPASRKEALTTYKDALAAYRGGEYASALGGFEAFLASGPQADYVDNALYWIGECHFGLGKFDAAVSYFQRVMAEQPDGNKVPDAMLKMSLAYDRTGRAEQASKLLEDLTRQFPATNAGRLASQKLAERR